MSEYELTDLAAAAMANFLATFTIFMSIVTAYAITAFVAGTRLTRIQLFVINACFLLSASTMGFLSYLIFGTFVRRAQTADSLGGIDIGTVVDFSWYVAFIYILLTLGCLLFMWNVRHPSKGK